VAVGCDSEDINQDYGDYGDEDCYHGVCYDGYGLLALWVGKRGVYDLGGADLVG